MKKKREITITIIYDTDDPLTLAWGAKAAAEPTRARVRASFMVFKKRGMSGC